MLRSLAGRVRLGVGWGLALAACSSPEGGAPLDGGGATSQPLTAGERLEQCRRDPRVIANLVSAEVCAGAGIFFEETFAGNGRTCGSCHPAANNLTLDRQFVQNLHASNARDPLFVAEYESALNGLETADLLDHAGVLENVDGFGADPTTRFVSRGVSHLLSLSTSIRTDGTGPSLPAESTGWGGDGSPDGTLRGFLRGAIEQHFPKSLAREPGVDFRLPDPDEEDYAEQFQLSLGRLNELDLSRVVLHDAEAENGRVAFMDPLKGRCNVCHSNAGANFIDTGNNRNFDTGTRRGDRLLTAGTFEGEVLLDGGFGGRDLERPDLDFYGDGNRLAFGDGTFNPPPLIEAADTAPFFHNNLHVLGKGAQDIEDAIVHYGRAAFLTSPAALELDRRFGQPLDVQPHAGGIVRFLRALNAAFNVDLARQRLDAVNVLMQQNPDDRPDVQSKLMELASVELDDATEVLRTSADLYPAALDGMALAREAIQRGINASDAAERAVELSDARARLTTARAEFGENITFQLGPGNLMY